MRNIVRYDEDGDKKLDKRVVINVGGCRHETWLSTIERIPNTRLALLAHLQEADENYDMHSNEYFFDRNSKAFDVILHYYRTEELHMDSSLCGNVFKSELYYWGMEEMDIEPCCWGNYSKYTDHKETLANLDDNFAFTEEEIWTAKPSKWRTMKINIWRFLEDPSSSRWAKAFAVFSMLWVATSILIFVAETHKLCQIDKITGKPMSEVLPDEDEFVATGSPTQCCCETTRRNGTTFVRIPHPVISYLDYACVAFFTLEIILRVSFAPNLIKFWKSLLNIIDILCLIPHWVAIIVEIVNPELATTTAFKTITVLRVVRVLRIFKLMKHYSAFKILAYTIKVSTKELLLVIVFLMSGVLMFASIIHFAEEDNFPNIPIGFWWALVTMTTVGYGDKYPLSYIGYLLGAVCVICGVLVIAFTVPIVVNNFSLYYQHAQSRIKVPADKRRKARSKQFLQAMRTTSPENNVPNDKIKLDNIICRETPQNKTPRQPIKTRETKNVYSKPPEHPQHKNNLNRNSQKELNKQVQTTKHTPRMSNREDSGTPVESTDPNDLQLMQSSRRSISLDSGFDDPAKDKKRHEEETKQLLIDLQDVNQKFTDERKRQEYIITKKREQRAQAQKTPRGEKTDDDDDGERTARKEKKRKKDKKDKKEKHKDRDSSTC